jgi:transposase
MHRMPRAMRTYTDEVFKRHKPRRRSRSSLAPNFCRKTRTRLGPPVATKAMAAKLAWLLYRMLRYGMKYVDKGAELYEAQHRKQQVIHLKRKAAPLGLEIIEVADAA